MRAGDEVRRKLYPQGEWHDRRVMESGCSSGTAPCNVSAVAYSRWKGSASANGDKVDWELQRDGKKKVRLYYVTDWDIRLAALETVRCVEMLLSEVGELRMASSCEQGAERMCGERWMKLGRTVTCAFAVMVLTVRCNPMCSYSHAADGSGSICVHQCWPSATTVRQCHD